MFDNCFEPRQVRTQNSFQFQLCEPMGNSFPLFKKKKKKKEQTKKKKHSCFGKLKLIHERGGKWNWRKIIIIMIIKICGKRLGPPLHVNRLRPLCFCRSYLGVQPQKKHRNFGERHLAKLVRWQHRQSGGSAIRQFTGRLNIFYE